MIVATSGHVDHGKTRLIEALTGVDTDRLPEEKRRGMTIDLGFAYLPLASGPTIGFVDVPGHERFVRNMLAGVAGIDFSLLVVAADDGPMPQTREHLAILDLLGIPCAAAVITKTDRVDAGRIAAVDAEVGHLFASLSSPQPAMFHVSAVTGVGIAELRSHVESVANTWRPREPRGNFRLAVDRRFNLAGAGLVVTGTVHSGQISVGGSARTLLGDLPVRVRSIHAQNAKSDIGRAGQRCALNLAGDDVDLAAIRRGEWIVTGNVPPPVRKIDIRLSILPGEARALSHWTPVHVHIGAAEVTGRVALLEGPSLAPGGAGLAQLVLDRSLGALHGDRVVIRDISARRTIGGGDVIDVYPPARGRARPERLAALQASEEEDDAAALAMSLIAAQKGLNLDHFSANRNLSEQEREALFASAPMRVVATDASRLGFSMHRWYELRSAVLTALAGRHRRAPDVVGQPEDHLCPDAVPREVTVQVVSELVSAGEIVKEGAGVRLASHIPRLASTDAALWRKVEARLGETGLRPPSVHEIATAIGMDSKMLEAFLVRASRLGLVVRVAKNRFYRPMDLQRLGELVEEISTVSDRGLVTAALLRDRSRLGRNLAIEVLEYFDRSKFTRRVGDAHQVVRPAADALASRR